MKIITTKVHNHTLITNNVIYFHKYRALTMRESFLGHITLGIVMPSRYKNLFSCCEQASIMLNRAKLIKICVADKYACIQETKYLLDLK